ncbi:hypothetical protein LWI29_022567 [Acer saccharum]|uniref:Uncharacterized protein n=1 Tax=Acer saccharum TaxID=4024 RepID=A0AA39W6W0_ACESA|nr:hypothetical protein LWI29_022567 [Acer saccharum]
MVKYLKPMQLFRESTKRTALLKQSTVLLGLNVCDKFVSCARSDRLKMFAFQYGCFKRDERILDNLVDKVQECMSEYNVEGIVFASKLYPVGPPVNIHTLMDDLGKKGKFESLKYTCWKDNTTSEACVY